MECGRAVCKFDWCEKAWWLFGEGGVEGKGSRGHGPFEVLVWGGGCFGMGFVSWGAIFLCRINWRLELESGRAVWKFVWVC